MSSQLGPRRRGMASDGWHGMQRCTTILSRNHAMDLIATKNKNALDCNSEETKLKTYKRRRVCRRGSSVPDELVYEILLRLPVKTLAWSKSVCRDWLAIISNPSFIRTHLKQQQSAVSRHEQKLSLLFTPHTLDSVIDGEIWPSTFSNIIPFYRWQEGQEDAHLVCASDLQGEFRSVYCMSHCDGLVLLPTDTRMYVFNPATGDVLELPDGQTSNLKEFQTAGLGLDLDTNTYKVVRSFPFSVDFDRPAFDARMEVFTISGRDSCWRTVAEDPPYPVTTDPVYFKGSLYWHICKELLQGSPPQGFLHFNLEDETFGLVLHDVVSPSDETRLDLVELGGELCLAQYLATQIVIWKSSLSSSGDCSHQWDRLYVIGNLPDVVWKFQRIFDLADHFLLVGPGFHIYHYDKASRSAKEVARMDQLVKYRNPRSGSVKDFYAINVGPYIENLVPLKRGEMTLLR